MIFMLIFIYFHYFDSQMVHYPMWFTFVNILLILFDSKQHLNAIHFLNWYFVFSHQNVNVFIQIWILNVHHFVFIIFIIYQILTFIHYFKLIVTCYLQMIIQRTETIKLKHMVLIIQFNQQRVNQPIRQCPKFR